MIRASPARFSSRLSQRRSGAPHCAPAPESRISSRDESATSDRGKRGARDAPAPRQAEPGRALKRSVEHVLIETDIDFREFLRKAPDLASTKHRWFSRRRDMRDVRERLAFVLAQLTQTIFSPLLKDSHPSFRPGVGVTRFNLKSSKLNHQRLEQPRRDLSDESA
jgi:hypothetical protein